MTQNIYASRRRLLRLFFCKIVFSNSLMVKVGLNTDPALLKLLNLEVNSEPEEPGVPGGPT